MKFLRILVLAGAAALLSRAAQAQGERWIGSWAAAQQTPETENALDPTDLQNATLRQILHLSAGGAALRVRVSNAFGTQPLRFTSVHLARARGPGSAAIDPASDRAATFAGRPDVTVPAGAEYWSDPVNLPVRGGADLAVSFHLAAAPVGQTSHVLSQATAFLVAGDQTAAADLPDARRIEHMLAISGVDVNTGGRSGAVLAFGDSITDGYRSTMDGNDRWPDVLAERLRSAGRTYGVMNVAISGNHMLTDGLGPNAIARFDRDVLAQDGVRTVILLEGINDLGKLSRDAPTASPADHAALLASVFAADSQFVAMAHEHGLKVIAGTLTPYVGSDYYHPGAANEADRLELNRWIATSRRFDAVIDFDKAVRDPAHPERMLPAYDSGDHLHPSPAGYRAMAEAIPLDLLPR